LLRNKIPKPGPARFSILCVSAVGQGTKVVKVALWGVFREICGRWSREISHVLSVDASALTKSRLPHRRQHQVDILSGVVTASSTGKYDRNYY